MNDKVSSEMFESTKRMLEACRLNFYRCSFGRVDKTFISATPCKKSPLELIMAENAAVLDPFLIKIP